MDALEGRQKRQRQMRAQPFREERSLIESALTLASGMQWNRNNDVETAVPKPLVIKCGHQPAGDQMPKMNLSPVFEIQDDVTSDPTCAICRDGGFKIKRAMRAIGAGKGIGDCAVK